MVAKNPIHHCWICGRAVSLEACKIDEQGNPVHEQCYVAKVAFNSGMLQRTTKAHRRLWREDVA